MRWVSALEEVARAEQAVGRAGLVATQVELAAHDFAVPKEHYLTGQCLWLPAPLLSRAGPEDF